MGCCTSVTGAKKLKEADDTLKPVAKEPELKDEDRRKFQDQKPKPKEDQDTPADLHERDLDRLRAPPQLKKQNKSTKIVQNVGLSDELKRAVYSNDQELLEEVLELN